MADLDLFPVVELAPFLEDPSSEEAKKQAGVVADSLKRTGVVVLRDPRVTFEDNDAFIDVMEKYWDRPDEEKAKDERPEIFYQLGVNPEFVEEPKCSQNPECDAIIEKLSDDNKPQVPKGPDPKCRFHWRIGDRPEKTEFAELNAPPVVPDNFPGWSEAMDNWGNRMIAACYTIAEMAATGLGLEQKAFSSMMELGPHILAPTGVNLAKHNKLNTIVAGFHTDLNFMTIHGKSRYPGLFVWLRDGTRVPVKLPVGCLVLQAGQQLEYLTAGEIKAGFHEVIVTPATLEALEKYKTEGRPQWRVSSTLFSHIASDKMLQPLGKFAETPDAAKYPPILTGKQVEAELKQIKLHKATADTELAAALKRKADGNAEAEPEAKRAKSPE